LVEVLLGKKLNVNKNWIDIVKTSNAKDHIRKTMKFEPEEKK
jgi:(p)ppGpp synthase/HD superfamily hydrolase